MPRVFEVARQTVLLHARGRLYLTITVLSMLFACVFFFLPGTSSRVRGDELFEMVTYGGAFTSFLPFVTLFLAAQAVSGDIEDRTSLYLFTRPIHRVSLMLGKWLAVILLGGVFVTVGMTALFAVIAFGGREWQYGMGPSAKSYFVMLLAGWIAVVGYSAIGCFFASFFRRPMLIGVLYIFLEQFASRLPAEVPIHTATIAFPIRVFMFTMMEPSYGFKVVLSGVMDATRGQESALMAIDPFAALAKLTAFAMLLALIVYSRSEYDSRPRE